MWFNLAERLRPFYDVIHQEVRGSPAVKCDETGWRVLGKTYWLWCFTGMDAVYYVIKPSRGSNVVLDVMGEMFYGTLVSDFYSTYNKIKTWSKHK